MRFPGQVVLVTLLASVACSDATGSSSDSLSELIGKAAQANSQHDVEAEERYLQEAVGREGSDRERAEARRNLALTMWKFHHEFDEASGLLVEAVSIGADTAKSWVGRAEMERSRRNYDAARIAAAKAVETADSSFDQRAATMTLAGAVVDAAVEKRLEGQPGDLDAAALLLSLALLLDRGSDAWEAWESYYYATEVDAGPGLVAEPGRRLRALLADWKGAEASRQSRTALAEALSNSRFYLEAALVALRPARAGARRHRHEAGAVDE